MDDFQFESSDLSYLLDEDDIDVGNEAILNASTFPDDCLPPEAQYSSNDELFEAIQDWAANRGYAFSIRRSRTIGSSKKRIEYYCDRHTPPASASRPRIRRTSSRRTDCHFSIIAKEKDNATWQVCHRSESRFNSHNHEPSPGQRAHPSHRALSDGVKEQILQLRKVGITPRDIQTLIRCENQESLHTRQDIYNQLKRSQVDRHNGESNMAALITALNSNGYWYQIQLGDDDRIYSILFSNIASLELVKRYPKVIIMDCTYKTNKYNLPLLHIIGVDACSNSFSIAYAFLNNEQAESYSWVLQQLRELFITQGVSPPQILVCDNWKATLIAIDAVFPSIKIQLCLWHVNKAVLTNCKASFQETTAIIWRAKRIAQAAIQARDATRAIYNESLGGAVEEACLEQAIISAAIEPEEQCDKKLDQAWKQFEGHWYAVLNADTVPQYEAQLSQFRDKYKDHYQAQLNYLEDVWLTPHKEKIVRAWTNQNMHYGNVTTSRVEGSHSRLKRYIRTSNKDLNDVWQAIHHATEQQVIAINSRHQFEQVNTPSDLHGKLYANVRGWVSFYALRLARKQERRLKDTERPLPSHCTGAHRQTYGIPCAHDLERLISRNQTLRLSHFDAQWHLQRDGQPLYIEEPNVLQTRSSIVRRRDIPAYSTQRDPSLFEVVESQPRRKPKCSRCHQMGHTMSSRQCPERNNTTEIVTQGTPTPTPLRVPTPTPMPTPAPAPAPRLTNRELLEHPEIIYSYYVEDRQRWYDSLPSRAVRSDSAYRKAKNLKAISRITKTQFNWCLELYQMGKQCGMGSSARPWTKEEMVSYLDFRGIYDRRDDEEADRQEQERCEREGYATRYRGLRHVWQEILEAQAQER